MTLDELRALSEKATPGPWWHHGAFIDTEARENPFGAGALAETLRTPDFDAPDPYPDAAFIVACVNYLRDQLRATSRSAPAAPISPESPE